MTMSPSSGYRCAQCRPGRPCSFCLSLAYAKREEAEPMQPVERKPMAKAEPEQGNGFDRGYDYERGEWRVSRRAVR